MMKKEEAVSEKLQSLALYGIKKDKLLPPQYGEWFHLLLYLAWHGWNVSVQGDKKGYPPNFEDGITEIKVNLKISDRDIEENFVSSDCRQVVRRIVRAKKDLYPNDRRVIKALEFTEQGTLRAYTTG